MGPTTRPSRYALLFLADLRNLTLPSLQNRWPETDLPDFKPFMNQFFEDCHRLHVEIMRALALAMGLGEGFFDDKVNQKAHNLRLCVKSPSSSSSPLRRPLTLAEGIAQGGGTKRTC